MKTFHLLISGKVQGVFFRATAKKVAAEYGINGWIRNTPDDCVEAVITGDSTSTDLFIAWCKSGPKRAVVEDVIVTPQNFVNFEHFEILH